MNELILDFCTNGPILARFDGILQETKFHKAYLTSDDGLVNLGKYSLGYPLPLKDRINLEDILTILIGKIGWFLNGETGQVVLDEVQDKEGIDELLAEYEFNSKMECVSCVIAFAILKRMVHPFDERIAKYVIEPCDPLI